MIRVRHVTGEHGFAIGIQWTALQAIYARRRTRVHIPTAANDKGYFMQMIIILLKQTVPTTHTNTYFRETHFDVHFKDKS